MKKGAGQNQLWNPPQEVKAAIRRGDKKCDPMREVKAKKKEAARDAR